MIAECARVVLRVLFVADGEEGGCPRCPHQRTDTPALLLWVAPHVAVVHLLTLAPIPFLMLLWSGADGEEGGRTRCCQGVVM